MWWPFSKRKKLLQKADFLMLGDAIATAKKNETQGGCGFSTGEDLPALDAEWPYPVYFCGGMMIHVALQDRNGCEAVLTAYNQCVEAWLTKETAPLRPCRIYPGGPNGLRILEEEPEEPMFTRFKRRERSYALALKNGQNDGVSACIAKEFVAQAGVLDIAEFVAARSYFSQTLVSMKTLIMAQYEKLLAS